MSNYNMFGEDYGCQSTDGGVLSIGNWFLSNPMNQQTEKNWNGPLSREWVSPQCCGEILKKCVGWKQ